MDMVHNTNQLGAPGLCLNRWDRRHNSSLTLHTVTCNHSRPSEAKYVSHSLVTPQGTDPWKTSGLPAVPHGRRGSYGRKRQGVSSRRSRKQTVRPLHRPHHARPTRRSSPLEPRTLLPPAPTTEPSSSFDSRLFDTTIHSPCEERYVKFPGFFSRLQSHYGE
jgi:hypothetical protein